MPSCKFEHHPPWCLEQFASPLSLDQCLTDRWMGQRGKKAALWGFLQHDRSHYPKRICFNVLLFFSQEVEFEIHPQSVLMKLHQDSEIETSCRVKEIFARSWS